MIPTQGTLFGPAVPVKTTVCMVCGRCGAVVTPTADPDESAWRCLACGSSGTRSWSREFGPRVEQGKVQP